MSDAAELAAWIELSLVPGLGGQKFRSLLSTFGLPTRILNTTRSQLGRVIPEALAARILERNRGPEVENTLQWAAQAGHALLTLADTEYPKQLLEIPDPPALLYVTGNVKLLSSSALAVVGSRNATPQGMKNAQSFARTLSEAGFAIVSGLALGVDSAAHRGGLEGRGSTIAVLGTGIDIVYPRRNQALVEEIASRGTVVAALDSGLLITARLAGEQGSEVLAIPGSIHSPLSKGGHALIKQGAKLVESAQDVLEELGGARAPDPTPSGSGANHELLDKMGFDPLDIDELIARSGLTTEVVSAILLQLELEGKIASLPGGLYQRIG